MPKKIAGKRRAAGHQDASAKLAVTLAEVAFPTTREELEAQIGDRRIPLDEDVDITVKEMLAHVRDAEFKKFSKAQRALNAHWQAYRADKGLQASPPEPFTEEKARGR